LNESANPAGGGGGKTLGKRKKKNQGKRGVPDFSPKRTVRKARSRSGEVNHRKRTGTNQPLRPPSPRRIAVQRPGTLLEALPISRKKYTTRQRVWGKGHRAREKGRENSKILKKKSY